jgi:2'-5' RNA ligase
LTHPLIVTALLGDQDFAYFDGLRQQHFPPERNVLRAHLTMFHHLPPGVETELCDRLKALARAPAPKAQLAGLMNLGRGVAFRIESRALEDIRVQLAEAFAPLLTPQDKAGWRPHVTVQNKVTADTARNLLAALSQSFMPRPVTIAGLGLFRYLDGPWESIGAWRFGAGHRMSPPPAFPR